MGRAKRCTKDPHPPEIEPDMLMKEAEPVMGTEGVRHRGSMPSRGYPSSHFKGTCCSAVGLGAACLLSQSPALFSPIHKLYVHFFVGTENDRMLSGNLTARPFLHTVVAEVLGALCLPAVLSTFII